MGLVLNSLVSGKHGTHHQCCERHAYRNFLRDSRVLNYLLINQRSSKIYQISFDMFIPLVNSFHKNNELSNYHGYYEQFDDNYPALFSLCDVTSKTLIFQPYTIYDIPSHKMCADVGIPEGLFPLTCLNFSQFGSGSLALAAFQLFLVFGSLFLPR